MNASELAHSIRTLIAQITGSAHVYTASFALLGSPCSAFRGDLYVSNSPARSSRRISAVYPWRKVGYLNW